MLFRKSQVLVTLLALLTALTSQAQFGNEWIDYSQNYWEFKIVESGLYSISQEELQAAGFPVQQIDPETIQLFGRGKELPLFFPGEVDGSFDPGERLYFYARANDGWLDALTYDESDHQANPHYSLFNDTAHYYLSYNSQNPGLRISLSNSEQAENYSPRDYLWKKSTGSYTSEYLGGVQDAFGIALPWYQEAEGWFDNRFPKGGSSVKDLPTPLAYQGASAPNARVKAVSASASLAAGPLNHHLQVGYGQPFQVVIDTAYYGYQLNTFNFELPADLIGNTTRITHRSIDDLGVATDFHAVSHIEIDYPHQSTAVSLPFEFGLDGIGNGMERISFSNLPGEQTVLYVFNSTGQAVQRVQAHFDGLSQNFLVPVPGGESVQMILVDEAQSASVIGLRPHGSTGQFVDYTSAALDSAFIIITHPKLWSEAQNYAFYRQTEGMDVLVVNIEELYHQYAAGIFQHPLAIRRFCDHLISSWESRPSHLFLIGKSIRGPSISNTPGSRKSPELYAANLVPTWGYPASDICLTAGLAQTVLDPAIPTGRLAAHNGETVLNYLNKVIATEQQAPASWMKRILHFGGGGNSFEQGLFANFLSGYRSTAQDTCFGGDVYTFLKTTSDPIQINLSDSIRDLINEGVALMTFFGHATSSGFDQNIDQPSAYNNQGKYPLLIGNSCYTGNVHLPTSNSTSETFVLYPNGGTIGFIAKGDLGSPYYLDIYTSNFYKEFSNRHYGSSIGQCMQFAIQSFQGEGVNLYLQNTALTFGLHGDPALKLFAQERPDYSILDNGIFFDPPVVTADIDSFDVVVPVFNLGKAVNLPLSIELIRHFPGGTSENQLLTIDPVLFSREARFRLPVDVLNGIGLNRFDVLVDLPADLIPELEDFSNNMVMGKELQITSGELIPVYPPKFAVVPDQSLTLRASTGNPFETEQSYIWQLDTTPDFSSNWLQSTTQVSEGGVLSWERNLLSQDSLVYFWRTAREPNPGESTQWHSSSFQFIAGKTGWGQAHSAQFQENGLNGGIWNDAVIDFNQVEVPLSCVVHGNASTSFESLDTRYQIDLDIQDYSGCGPAPAIHVAVIDSLSLRPWETNFNGLHPQWDFGNLMTCTNSRGRPEKYFIFRQNDPAQLQSLANMLSSEIPTGNYLLIYTWKYVTYTNWELYAPELFEVFNDLGAGLIGNAQDSVPFIFFQKLGDPLSRIEVYGSAIDELIQLEADLTGSPGLAFLTPPAAGASTSWEALYWDFGMESNSSDSLEVKLFGLNPVGQSQLLSTYQESQGAETDLSNEVNASVFPKLALQAILSDTLDLTPPQPRSWHLLHDEVPEAALNPNHHFSFGPLEAPEGEEIMIALAISNIGQVDMDSLLVKYWVEDASGGIHPVDYPRQDSLKAGQHFIDTVHISTFGLSGRNTLWIEANPRNPFNGIPDQPELTHFNNLGQVSFNVASDLINPILDVTFDGRHLLDGELVSASPSILISLRDENPYFLLNEDADTSNFRIYLTTPELEQLPVYFSSATEQELFWTPASGSENKFLIEYYPKLELDGEYRLLVQATDQSGNASGRMDYEISFEVMNKPSISEVLNYPNPFSTRTQFVFTLTGSETPEIFRIQIMTITGRVVREIDQTELGPLRIGRNMTDYWWDGRDEFGDPLANGVYLYRVLAKLNGEDVEVRETAASPYFVKGVGKMYLMR